MPEISLAFDDQEQLPAGRIWRYLVVRRDRFRCNHCGVHEKDLAGRSGPRNSSLHAHHINGDQTDNRLANGMTLCGPCHNRLHNTPDKGKRGGEAVKVLWASRTPDERAEAVAQRRPQPKCPPGCTCKRHSKFRATHCGYGHEFTEANTYTDKKGRRSCRACRRRIEAQARQKAKKA